jgi:peptidoglycan/LPS O-acetylase OafA/YrhL
MTNRASPALTAADGISLESGRFRPDIQGLRAVSILAVVGYHAGIPGFAGGFIGVDIFFVISGFLICGLLLREAEKTGSVDLLRFWGRRARRLLPNACLTLLVVIGFGLMLMPAHLQPVLAKEVMYAAVYLANYYFASRAIDYFRQDDPPSLVMHFWSLSVEEQFYIVWPVLVLLAARFLRASLAKVLLVTLSAIAVASFAASLYWVPLNQPLAFFHGGTRAWQLAAGGILAVCLRARAAPPAGPALAWGGLGVIVLSIVLLHDQMVYPGLRALLPVLGAAAVVAGGHSQTGPQCGIRLLTARGMQWIGARSYSWYLWHWPALQIGQMVFPDALYVGPLALLASLAVANLAFAFIEEPIRRGRALTAGPIRTVLGAATASATICAAAAALIIVPSVAAPAQAERLQWLRSASTDFGENYSNKCHLGVPVVEQPPCLFGKEGAKRRVVLFGDSHAAQWFEPLRRAAEQTGYGLHAWTKLSCPPIDAYFWYKPRRSPFNECRAWYENVMARLTGPDRPDVVFLSSLLDYSGWVLGSSGRGSILAGRDSEEEMRNGMLSTVRRLEAAGVTVVVIRDTPQAYLRYLRCLERQDGAACGRPRREALRTGFDVAVAHQFSGRVRLLDVSDQICGPTLCPAAADGIVVYRDRHHLTATFAATFTPRFAEILDHRLAN